MANKYCLVCILVIIVYITTKGNCQVVDEIVTDLSQHCKKNEYYILDQIETSVGKFPKCIKMNSLNINMVKCNDLNSPCPPGYDCIKEKCKMNIDSCGKWHYQGSDIENKWKSALFWKPKCLDDGSYVAKQCKGETTNGRCFCYSAKGKRILGQQWSRKADDMTCACSRRRSDIEDAILLKKDSRQYVSLHCDLMGNYEPLQCDSNQCWCAEAKTGKLTSPIVPEKMMTFLPCYNATALGYQYNRKCESELFAQKTISHELLLHGTDYNNFGPVVCDADGSYGSKKILNGIVYCIWKDFTNLGSWQSALDANFDQIDCNCARDSKFFSDDGQNQMLTCGENGNYKRLQLIGKLYFCVDGDGFITSEGFENDQVDCDFYM